jgi:hypothetical protein
MIRLPGQDDQDRTTRIGLVAQDCYDKTVGQNRKERTARKGQLEQDSYSITGQPEWDSQNGTGRTGLPGKEC